MQLWNSQFCSKIYFYKSILFRFRMSSFYLKLKSTLVIGGASVRNQRIMRSRNVTFVRAAGSANNVSKCGQRIIFLTVEDVRREDC